MHGSCTHGAVRLVGGTTTKQGRVEVCVGQTWGTVCDDAFGTNDARVVCRQLGYNVDQTGTCKFKEQLQTRLCIIISCMHAMHFNFSIDRYKYSAFYGQGSGSIWLDNLGCTGNEQRLLDCAALPIGEHNCGHSEDVGVVCSGNLCSLLIKLMPIFNLTL